VPCPRRGEGERRRELLRGPKLLVTARRLLRGHHVIPIVGGDYWGLSRISFRKEYSSSSKGGRVMEKAWRRRGEKNLLPVYADTFILEKPAGGIERSPRGYLPLTSAERTYHGKPSGFSTDP